MRDPRQRDRALRIAMLGLGYVGTTTAACLLKDGHEVVGVDVSQDKLDSIGRGRSPQDPQALHRTALGDGEGSVLDPVVAIRG